MNYKIYQNTNQYHRVLYDHIKLSSLHVQYLRMATHHTMVSLLFSTLPRVILCTAWPDLTLHSLMLSTPPVRMTSKLVFQAIDKILPVKKKLVCNMNLNKWIVSALLDVQVIDFHVKKFPMYFWLFYCAVLYINIEWYTCIWWIKNFFYSSSFAFQFLIERNKLWK